MVDRACTAVIVAAGRGQRMGAGQNKVFLPLGSRAVIWWTLQGFLRHPAGFDPVVLVAAQADIARMQELVAANGWTNRVVVVPGGKERVDSVRNGLAVLTDEKLEWVAVHDGARPLFTAALLSRCIEKACRHGSAVAAVPVKDTIKQAGKDGRVLATPDRAGLYAVQTPQVFRLAELKQAYAGLAGDLAPTDDAMVMEAAGYPVYLAAGDYENIKLTTPEDLLAGEAILQRRLGPDSAGGLPGVSAWRTGFGYDVHRLVTGRNLILGGVRIPCEKGLLGHSDADVLVHAVMDALLGAAGQGDIGRHFPDQDVAYRGISSLKLCERVVALLAAGGRRIGNIDATIVAQRPKLAPYIPEMVRNISAVAGVSPDRVNVKATTTEGLGFAGTGEGIAAYAVATVTDPATF
ncbi:MAG: 2-C-methyl-D-erythritol 4-phosphate cytidylyltransferase [Heliobacteriaceae bacterium]|nr:2-C-methyl-D-erythritol 4-phosphate cytidylyltransferase [Heliobacteriaceae bacterium]